MQDPGRIHLSGVPPKIRRIVWIIGKDFAETHHVVPLSRLREHIKTRLEDLVTVCATATECSTAWKEIAMTSGSSARYFASTKERGNNL